MSQTHRPTLVALDIDSETLRQVTLVASPFFRVVLASDPRRAVHRVQTDMDVAVFMTEQVMRTTDGTSLLQLVRTMRPQVRRIILTSYPELARVHAARDSGLAQHVVAKPFTTRELLEGICPEVLRSAAARAAG